ncbi:MAG: glutathione S-transferase N-terminal domain-containing protein [Thalassospira sp.]|uniref:glutathione S-transferase family protein n=1 Tax=Thalassospira sp. TaxID=1912094 RepID=UPI0032EC4E05
MYPHFRLVGHRLCPYVQRVSMVMVARSIPHERVDILLDQKPDWLFEISPTGKVPVLVVYHKRVLFEAAAICEYLDDLSGKNLFPSDPYARGVHRSLIVIGAEILALTARLIYQDMTEEQVDLTMHQMTGKLELIARQHEAGAAPSDGPLMLLDFVFATIFRPFALFAIALNRDLFAGMEGLRGWSIRLSEHEVVQNAVPRSYQAEMQKFIADKDGYLSHRLGMLPSVHLAASGN